MARGGLPRGISRSAPVPLSLSNVVLFFFILSFFSPLLPLSYAVHTIILDKALTQRLHLHQQTRTRHAHTRTSKARGSDAMSTSSTSSPNPPPLESWNRASQSVGKPSTWHYNEKTNRAKHIIAVQCEGKGEKGRARAGRGWKLSLSLSLSPATIGPAPKSTLAISSTPVSSLVSAHCSVDSARSKERHSRFVEIPCSGHRLVPFLLWNAIAALQIHGCVDHRPPLAKRLEKGSSSWNVHPSSISFYRKAAELPEFSYGL